MEALRTVSSGPWDEGRNEVVSVTGPLVHRCPFRDEWDYGHVTITWQVDGQTLELHDLATYLESYSTVVVSHEDITGQIFWDVKAAGLDGVKVETEWDTAGFKVTVVRTT